MDDFYLNNPGLSQKRLSYLKKSKIQITFSGFILMLGNVLQLVLSVL